MTQLHRVVEGAREGAVTTIDRRGVTHRVSLVALDGPEPAVGSWLSVHSGYALERLEEQEAEQLRADLDRAEAVGDASGMPISATTTHRLRGETT